MGFLSREHAVICSTVAGVCTSADGLVEAMLEKSKDYEQCTSIALHGDLPVPGRGIVAGEGGNGEGHGTLPAVHISTHRDIGWERPGAGDGLGHSTMVHNKERMLQQAQLQSEQKKACGELECT